MKKKSLIFIVFFQIFYPILGVERLTILGDKGGPVMGSLCRGLDKLEFDYNINPAPQDLHDVVIVISNISKLRYAINLKKTKRIKKLLAGPNLMIRADDYNRIAASPEIDKYLVPSEWCRIAYQEVEPRLKGKIELWYAGVDPDKWNSFNKTEEKVIVYWKNEGESFCNQVETLLQKYGFEIVRLRYGSYKLNQYKELLKKTKFCVFLSRSESQGIALAESWSMDVPTIAWNPKELVAHGRRYSIVSACPLLTTLTGRDWQNLQELESLICKYESICKDFSPRSWVLGNLTDQKSAELLLSIVDRI